MQTEWSTETEVIVVSERFAFQVHKAVATRSSMKTPPQEAPNRPEQNRQTDSRLQNSQVLDDLDKYPVEVLQAALAILRILRTTV